MSNHEISKFKTINDLVTPNGEETTVGFIVDENIIKAIDKNRDLVPFHGNAPIDINTALMPFTAFVSPQYGDDNTGVVGDANKPFATVGFAQDQTTYIYLTPSNYSETIFLKSGKTYYAPFGVKFISGGLRCNTLISKTKWLGHADFYGNFFAIYLLGGEYRDVTIEFNSITTLGASSRSLYVDAVGTTTNIDIKGVYIDAYGANAHGVRFQGVVTGSCTISNFVRCPYGTVAFGFSGKPLIGKFVFNCPKIILENGGFVGNLPQYKQAVFVIDADPQTDITVNGDIYNQMTSVMGSVSGSISTLSGAVSGGVLKFNGNIYSGALIGVRNQMDFNIIVKGDIESTSDRAFLSTQNSQLTIKGSTIKTFNASLVSANAKVFISDSEFYCSKIGGHIIQHTTLGARLYLTSVNGETNGVGLFIWTNAVATIGGLINCVSNRANDGAFTNLYTVPNGFTVEPNLITNKNI